MFPFPLSPSLASFLSTSLFSASHSHFRIFLYIHSFLPPESPPSAPSLLSPLPLEPPHLLHLLNPLSSQMRLSTSSNHAYDGEGWRAFPVRVSAEPHMHLDAQADRRMMSARRLAGASRSQRSPWFTPETAPSSSPRVNNINSNIKITNILQM